MIYKLIYKNENNESESYDLTEKEYKELSDFLVSDKRASQFKYRGSTFFASRARVRAMENDPTRPTKKRDSFMDKARQSVREGLDTYDLKEGKDYQFMYASANWKPLTETALEVERKNKEVRMKIYNPLFSKWGVPNRIK